MESKHTPGQWKVKCVKTSIGRCFKVGPEPIIEMGHGAICLYDDNTDLNPLPHDEIEANARLIAAAPELLEACRNVAGSMFAYLHTGNRPLLDTVEAWHTLLLDAIAKAKSE